MTIEQQSDRASRGISPSLQDNSVGGEIDLSELARTLWRGKFFIVLCAAIALIFGIWYGYVKAVPVYTSNTVLVLETRQDQIVDIESVTSGLGGDQVAINTEIEVIRSRGLAEKVVNALNLTEDPEFNPALRTAKPSFSIGTVISYVRAKVVSLFPRNDDPAPR